MDVSVTDEVVTDVEPPAFLPDRELVGETQTWMLPDRAASDGNTWVTAQLLGVASSRRDRHSHATELPGPTERCGRCRWFEPRIFLVDDRDENLPRGRFLVHFAGRSSLPGETVRGRSLWVRTGFEVIEALTTRRADTESVYLTNPAAQVLAQAAAADADIEHAYVNRAVE